VVAAGVVTSLARPGGNVTGISIMGAEMVPKRFELLSELVPAAKVIALLVNPNNPTTDGEGRFSRPITANQAQRRELVFDAPN
jgi:putative ABC transport system substrate-binding protein